jgi:hypothetical protein
MSLKIVIGIVCLFSYCLWLRSIALSPRDIENHRDIHFDKALVTRTYQSTYSIVTLNLYDTKVYAYGKTYSQNIYVQSKSIEIFPDKLRFLVGGANNISITNYGFKIIKGNSYYIVYIDGMTPPEWQLPI